MEKDKWLLEIAHHLFNKNKLVSLEVLLKLEKMKMDKIKLLIIISLH